MAEQLKRTGQCFCGCGGATKSFWAPGHDRTSEAGILRILLNDVDSRDKTPALIARFIVANGYGPGGKNLHDELKARKKSL